MKNLYMKLCKYKNKAGNLPLRGHSVRFNFKFRLYFVLIFFMFSFSNQVFAQQTITIIDKKVEGNVIGNAAYLDAEGMLKYLIPSRNKIKIVPGGEVFGSVVGGFGTNDDRDPSNNIVSIAGGDVTGSIFGGLTNYGKVTGNTIAIFDGHIKNDANKDDKKAIKFKTKEGKEVNLDDISSSIFGGAVNDGTATGNSVAIFGGGIESNLVSGGFVINAGNVSNNIVTIDGGSLSAIKDKGFVVGGCTTFGNAINNSVTVNDGVVHDMDIFGGAVIGNGDATGNSVTINGGTTESRIVCGGIVFGDGYAKKNKVTIASNQKTIEFLCGGLTSQSGDAFTENNTLCIKTSGLTVLGGISNFQNYDFYLPANMRSGDCMLTSKNSGLSLEIKSLKDPLKDLFSHCSAGAPRPINLDKTNINAYIAGDHKLLRAGDSFSLIRSQQKGFEGSTNNSKLTLKQGFAFRYACELSAEIHKSDLTSQEIDSTLDLTVVSNAKFNQEVKSFSEGRAASVAFLNQGSDVISDKGLSEAVTSVSPNSIKSVSYFAVVSGVKLKYNTGSHAKVNGISALTGLAKGIDVKFGQLTTGVFFEYGSSDYNTSNSFSEFSSVEGGGNARYKGGGVLGHFDFRNNFYGEVSGRIGSITTTFYSSDITYGPDVFAKYNYDTQYVGAHAGGGYLWDINNKLGLNLYGKYFFTHQNGKDVVLSTNEVVKFANTNSKRARVGANFSNNVSKGVSLYCDVAYEYELDGIVNATMSGRNILAPSLKGGTGIGEIGVKGSVGTCSVDLSAQCYTGSREGFSGMLRLSFAFFNYVNRCLGYSLEKFYDKENTGRFNQMFNMSKKECFDKSLDIIKKLKERVTHKSFRKGYIVAFDLSKSFKYLCLDSTEVCIFITEAESGSVNVEVVSTNSFLAQAVSVEFFKMLGQDTSTTNASKISYY
jgi:hypothetical protein